MTKYPCSPGALLRLVAAIGMLAEPATLLAAPPDLTDCNVVFNEPARDSFDSMPLSGIRGAGANVWFQDGTLWLYLAHSGAWNESSELLKLGALRVTPVGVDLSSPAAFRQELDLATGKIKITAKAKDGTELGFQLWFAGESLVLESKQSRPLALTVEYGSWRAKPDAAANAPEQVTTQNQTLLFFHQNGDALRARNEANAQHIPLDVVPQIAQGRVFGGALAARGGLTFTAAVPVSWQTWKGYAWPMQTQSASRHLLTVAMGAMRNVSPSAWQTRATALLVQDTLEDARLENQRRWNGFWNRSHVLIRQGAPAGDRAAQIGRNYMRFRYMSACNQDGEMPLKFNGGIFTTDARIDRVPPHLSNAGCLSFSHGANPDFMRWTANMYMGQNQRWIGWPTVANGDSDLLAISRAFYRERLKVAEARAKNLNAEGACYIEPLNPEGLCCVAPTADGLCGAAHIRYHFSMGLEHAWMTLRGHSTLGGDIRPDLPWMIGQLRFLDSFYRAKTKTRIGKEFDENGKLCLYPSNGLEIALNATNPIETVAALRAVTRGLLALPEIAPTERAFLEKFQTGLPELPVAEKNGRKIYNLADKWEGIANGWEFSEMYPAWPYRLTGVLHPETLPVCRATWELQTARGDNQRQSSEAWDYGGKPGSASTPIQKRDLSWQSNLANAAALGLTDEAANYAVSKLSDRASCTRFPAFFGPGHDWMPDHNWGGSGMIGIQEMLMACDERQILLFPAWPRDWDVNFKLHAPKQTTVECELRNGKVIKLVVTPESRRKDVEIPSALQ